jgi:hypothetical protein
VTIARRAVVVHRKTEYEELLAGHGTRPQIRFFLESRGRSLDEVEERHALQGAALQRVTAAIPPDWRRGTVLRDDLDRYLFAVEDIVLVVGQDGLVANVAKYLQGQPVIGVDPSPGWNAGVLVQHTSDEAIAVMDAIARGAVPITDARTMVEATADDGQVLRALNEVFIGHPTHQSARYLITAPGYAEERQSSSGVLVGTGTGSTGWLRSAWLERKSQVELPSPTAPQLAWFVREAWPSPATNTLATEGLISAEEQLAVVSGTDRLVIFGDGIERDAIALPWGQSCSIGLAPTRLNLVTGTR